MQELCSMLFPAGTLVVRVVHFPKFPAGTLVSGVVHFEVSLNSTVYLGCVVNRFVLYYANVKKGCRENGECIRTT